jgi:hypothetical protein
MNRELVFWKKWKKRKKWKSGKSGSPEVRKSESATR